MIGLDDDGRLAFGLRPVAPSSALNGTEAPVGSVLENCPAATTIVRPLAERITAEGGAALIIDYGHAEHGFGDTLQAVRSHSYDDPLAHPGAVDLTAHVDFAALAKAAAKAGAAPREIIDQATFLPAWALTIASMPSPAARTRRPWKRSRPAPPASPRRIRWARSSRRSPSPRRPDTARV